MRLLDWITSRWRLLQKVSELRHALALKQTEIASLERQIIAATDFIDAMSWESRAVGAKAKATAESLRKREGE